MTTQFITIEGFVSKKAETITGLKDGQWGGKFSVGVPEDHQIRWYEVMTYDKALGFELKTMGFTEDTIKGRWVKISGNWRTGYYTTKEGLERTYNRLIIETIELMPKPEPKIPEGQQVMDFLKDVPRVEKLRKVFK